MNKLIRVLLILAIALTSVYGIAGCGGVNAPDNKPTYTAPTTLNSGVVASDTYYVSETGDDNGLGTEESPFRSLQAGLLAVKTFKNSVNADMDIVVSGDVYLHEELVIDGSYNLPSNHVLTIRSKDGEKAILNGGTRITNWTETDVNGHKVWVAKISDEDSVRSFSVNGSMRPLAARFNELNSMHKMMSRASWKWAIEGEETQIKILDDSVDLTKLHNPTQLEIAMICEWKTFIFKTASIISKDTVELLQPYASWFTTPASVGNLDPGGHWYPNPKHGLWLQNDVSLIDERGEWCFDKSEKQLYYYPMEGETITDTHCVAARLDQPIGVQGGKDSNNRFTMVKNVRFEGITFMMGPHF